MTLKLETPRLVVTQPPPSAAPRIVRYFEDNRTHFARFDPPRPEGFYGDAYWKDRLARNVDEAAAGISLRTFILRRDDPEGAIQGVLNFSQIFRGPLLSCVLGFGLDHRAVGQGIMHEAATAGIRHVFETLRLHRIEANHLPTNERSARLLARLGFVVEGYAREYLFIDGAWRDHVRTSLTNPAPVLP